MLILDSSPSSFKDSFHNPDLLFLQSVKLVDQCVDQLVSLPDSLPQGCELAHRSVEFSPQRFAWLPGGGRSMAGFFRFFFSTVKKLS